MSGMDRSLLHSQQRYRSEEHTSELQSRSDIVCRLLLEKKKKLEQTSQDRQGRIRRRDPRVVGGAPCCRHAHFQTAPHSRASVLPMLGWTTVVRDLAYL